MTDSTSPRTPGERPRDARAARAALRTPPRHAAPKGRRARRARAQRAAAAAGAGPTAVDAAATTFEETTATQEAGTGDAPGTAAAWTADLRRGSLLMTIGTAASRASGQVRTMLLVGAIGTLGAVANAFDIANTLPNMLFALLAAGVLQAVLMPQIMRAMQAPDGRERLDKLLTLSLLGILLISVVLVVLAPWLVGLFTLGDTWTSEQRELATVFAYWCVPQVFFYGVFTLLGQVLNARGRFGAYGWAPVANNVVSVVGFGAFILLYGSAPDGGINDVGGWSTGQTVLLAGTATLGIAAQAAILVGALRRAGFRWRFRLGLRGIGLRTAGKVVGWTIGAVVLEQVGVTFLKNVTSAASGAAEAADVAGNAAYTNAMTIYLLPHSLVVVSIVTALFPRMSAAAAAGDVDGVRRDMSTGLRTAGVFSVFSAVVMLVLARPLTKSLLPTLGPAGVDAGGPVLQAMALGLVALGITVMVKRMYYAFEDGRSIFVIQIFATASMVAALWAATRLLPAELWAVAAGAAYALSTWISVLLRVRGMSRKLHGMDGARILRLYVRAGVAAAVAGVTGWYLARLFGVDGDLSWPHALGITAACGLVMLGAYLALLKLMRVRELDDALRPILRRLGR
ncbi:murein biosynthesis integral membrane protein MurJ [Puerhibacterium sp. TATVAM-FAB25]|uniref:murein biosynthesis integral membrane protein MurJ n=1 Tax=Puerhibacterium sp. TATVAM-FAB25 TaxID=3093699 RepID=UPI00397B8ED8